MKIKPMMLMIIQGSIDLIVFMSAELPVLAALINLLKANTHVITNTVENPMLA